MQKLQAKLQISANPLQHMLKEYLYWCRMDKTDFILSFPLPKELLEHEFDPSLNHQEQVAATARKAVQIFTEEGFQIRKVSIGGGVSEIYHTGIAPFYKDYESLLEFTEHFADDFSSEEKKRKEETGGWITSLDFGFVRFDLLYKEDHLIGLMIPANNYDDFSISVPDDLPLASLMEIYRIVDQAENQTIQAHSDSQ